MKEKDLFNKGYNYSFDQYRKLEKKNVSLKKFVDKMFNEDHKEGMRGINQTFMRNVMFKCFHNKALHFPFACGGTGYNLLRKINFPKKKIGLTNSNSLIHRRSLEAIIVFLINFTKQMSRFLTFYVYTVTSCRWKQNCCSTHD